NGMYSGTWTPSSAGESLAIKFLAMHAAYGTVTRTITVSAIDVAEGQALPSIAGVVDAAGFSQGWPIAPGSIISIFGSNLAAEEGAAAGLPLPATINGVSVQIGGRTAPLFYVGPNQINA